MSGAATVEAWSERARSAAAWCAVRAVLLDVDGTLYRQMTVYARMALEIAALPLAGRSLTHVVEVSQTIRHFRRITEELRHLADPAVPLSTLHFQQTARRVGADPAQVECTVREWLFARPLKHLRDSRRAGVDRFLASARRAGLEVGVLSDYPAADKLEALGLSHLVSLVLCTTDPLINALKPHPRGFLQACRAWGLASREVLYVGDRPDVDAVGACRAGMRCAILSRSRGLRRTPDGAVYLAVRGFAELQAALAA
jgi:HAD superfamily hydrolase (TIGR01549 family)